jgi:magnesium-transporting ATPase (P-type)
MTSQPIYTLRVPEVLQALETTPQGLTEAERELHLRLDGPNTLPDPPRPRVWRRVLVHLTYPMALLLWAGGLLALVIGQPELAGLVWAIILINAVFSFWQEYRAEQTVLALGKLLPAYTRILRDGQEVSIPASQVVPGDILVLGQGDNVPADARVIEQYGLRANQTILTGEAMAAVKTADASLREGITELERPNLIFAGTSIVSGTARAVVYASGALTQFGRIARLSQQIHDEQSPLQGEIFGLTRIIFIAAIGLGIVVFAVGSVDVGIPLVEALILSIGIIIAVVPEGLRPTLTLSLAIAVQRLARRGVLVKKLAMLETLGTISVICTDKSGTLTQNQMTVREVWLGGRRLSVSGVGYEPIGEFSPSPDSVGLAHELDTLRKAAYLCNNARLIPPGPQTSQWNALGDQTEAALRTLALKAGVDEAALLRDYPRIHELPFDAVRKRMSTIHQVQDVEVAFVKGAPKEVLGRCRRIVMVGKECSLDEALRSDILTANDDYARRALRVLALAYRELPPRQGAYTHEGVERDLVFIGLVAMMDPARPDVAHSMEVFREAGIRLVMITGDYGLTAESLARRIGMLQTEHPRILTGSDLEVMSDVELIQALDEEIIFARVAPEQKLKVVSAFQTRGETVAFSGDGVNDAPALRKADVGITMGITGTDVAREAADIVLTQDRFGDIAAAVEEGRAIYENIRKFLTYILASNVPEIVPFLLTALLNIPLALMVSQILAIDLGTDLLPALALGIEPPERETMQAPPRARQRRLIDNGLLGRAVWIGSLETILCYAGFYLVYALADPSALAGVALPSWLGRGYYLSLTGGQVNQVATTVFFAGVIMAQIGSAITSRTERVGVRRLGLFRNAFLLIGILCEIAVALILIYAAPVAHLFHLMPFTPGMWAFVGSFALVVYMLDRIRKVVLRSRARVAGNGEKAP